jgi:hypothetical protein
MQAAGFGAFAPLQAMLVASPLGSTFLNIFLCGVIWKFPKTESIARRYSGKFMVGLTDSMNSAKVRKYWEIRSAEKLARKGSSATGKLERIFDTGMMTASTRENRYVLGNLYTMLGWFWSQGWWRYQMLLLLLFIPILCYVADGTMRNYVFAMPAFFAIWIDTIPHRSLLLARGRQEKLYASIVSAIVVTISLTIIVLIVATLSILAAPIMPAIPWRGTLLPYHAIDIRYFYVVPLLVPLVELLASLYPKQRNILSGFLAMVGIWLTTEFHGSSLGSFIGTVGVFILVAASWIVFVVINYYHCHKQDLVGAK